MPTSTDPFAPGASPTRLSAVPTAAPVVVPVIEERAVITREVVESGRVRLVKEVHEHEELVDLMLQHDEVQVERVPVNQFVADEAALPDSRYDGDTLIIPVLREVVVTRVLVVEEIRVTKRQVVAPHTERVPLRREDVRVERHPATDLPAADSVF